MLFFPKFSRARVKGSSPLAAIAQPPSGATTDARGFGRFKSTVIAGCSNQILFPSIAGKFAHTCRESYHTFYAAAAGPKRKCVPTSQAYTDPIDRKLHPNEINVIT